MLKSKKERSWVKMERGKLVRVALADRYDRYFRENLVNFIFLEPEMNEILVGRKKVDSLNNENNDTSILRKYLFTLIVVS